MQSAHCLSSKAQCSWGPGAGSRAPKRPYKTVQADCTRQVRLARAAWSEAGAAGPNCSSCPHNQREPQQCTCGVVIVDHGSRRKASNDMLVEFCQLYQQITQHQIVEPAHMEIAEPSIAQAIGRCVEAGARHVVVAPYFLSRGRHIQDDIPALVAAAREQYSSITCSIAEPIGIEPLMVKIIQQRVHAALDQDCPAAGGAAEAAHDTQAAAVFAASLGQQ